MRKRLNLLGAAVLLSALGACSRPPATAGGVSAEEERQLDNAAAMTNDNVFDTSPDDMALNMEDGAVDENDAAPADNAGAPATNRVGNRQ